jgi:hypothetical protein
MPTVRERRLFCEALGIKLEQVKEERVADAKRPLQSVWRVSHPAFGAGEHADQEQAWHRFFDVAEKAPPLPLRCEATTKDGRPCKAAPQAGYRHCGPHRKPG